MWLTYANLQNWIIKVYIYGIQKTSFRTKTTHVHNASHCAMPVRIAHVGRPCGAEMSEISQSSRTTMVESSMKSEHNLYLACEDSPQHAFFFWTFSRSLLALLPSTVHWLRNFLNAANRWLHSVLDSAKHVRCGAPATLPYHPRLSRSTVVPCPPSLG